MVLVTHYFLRPLPVSLPLPRPRPPLVSRYLTWLLTVAGPPFQPRFLSSPSLIRYSSIFTPCHGRLYLVHVRGHPRQDELTAIVARRCHSIILPSLPPLPRSLPALLYLTLPTPFPPRYRLFLIRSPASRPSHSLVSRRLQTSGAKRACSRRPHRSRAFPFSSGVPGPHFCAGKAAKAGNKKGTSLALGRLEIGNLGPWTLEPHPPVRHSRNSILWAASRHPSMPHLTSPVQVHLAGAP